MIVLDTYKMELGELSETLSKANAQMKPQELQTDLKELEDQMSAADFWNDIDNANKITQRVKILKDKLERLRRLNAQRDDIQTLIEMAEEEEDESLTAEIKSELADLQKKVEALRLEMLLKGPYDSCNAVLSLHAGAGGTEAQDWTDILYRMYSRYCDRRGWSVKELDLLPGENAGIKSVTFEVEGENAYGYLKAEKGVHRLVRISPFDANARRQTSFSSLDVTPIFDDDSNDIKIEPDDIRVDTYRSGGAGGEFARKCKALGAYTIGIRRSLHDKPDYVDELYTPESLDSLLPRADVIALSVPGTDATQRMVNRDNLKLMKQGAIILNVGRGNALDTDALADYVECGRLLCGLDVTDPEPLPREHKLWSLKNAVITPHVSGFFHLKQTLDRIVDISARNLGLYLAGEPLLNTVDKESGYRSYVGRA